MHTPRLIVVWYVSSANAELGAVAIEGDFPVRSNFTWFSEKRATCDVRRSGRARL